MARGANPNDPEHLVAFTTSPGDGCEDANFGLCRYQNAKGWSWASFCKTQYASSPDCGGMPNFLRCHLLVVALLDAAKELGILSEVKDEGGFWDTRDVKALGQELGRWNESTAAVVGQLKDMDWKTLQAPILEFPDFEHLEAKGREKLSQEDEGE